jgi:hypothetical protein
MADDQLADFLKRQANPAIRSPRSAPQQRFIITRLHLPFGDVFRLTVQVTIASLIVSVGLWVVALILMIAFGVGLGWLAR